MKKTILFIALIAFGLSINAQSFLVVRGDNGNEINGQTTFILSRHDGGIRTDYIHLINITETPVAIRLQIEKLQLAAGADVAMCFGGNCILDTIAGDENIVTMNPDEEYTGFDLQYTYDNMDLSKVKVNLLNPVDNSLIQSFIVYYSEEEVSLNDVLQGNSTFINMYPNPANNTVCIKYATPDDCKNPSVIVKNMLGKEVRNLEINNNQNGKVYINTGNLPQGVYFCSIVCEGQAIVTKKLIVKH